MPYPLPSWLPGAPDVGAQVLAGIRTGSAIQQEQARLAQEANLTQMRLMLQQQEQERQNTLEQQRMAQSQAYNQAQIGLQQQELAEKKRINDIKVQEAARTFQAQQNFAQWMQANPDRDPAEGILKFFPGTDVGSMAGLGTLARTAYLNRQALQPPEQVSYDVDGNKVSGLLGRTSGGGYSFHQFKVPGQDPLERQALMEQLRAMEKDRFDLEKEIRADTEGRMAARQAAAGKELGEAGKGFLQAYQDKLARLQGITQDITAYRNQLTGRGTAPAPAPAAPAGGAQFRYDPGSGKIVPTAAAAPESAPVWATDIPTAPPISGGGEDWTGGAAVMPQTPQGLPQDNPPAEPIIPPPPSVLNQIPQYRIGRAGLENLLGGLAPVAETGYSRMSGIPGAIGGGLTSTLRGFQNLVSPFLQGQRAIAPVIGRGAQNIINPPSLPPALADLYAAQRRALQAARANTSADASRYVPPTVDRTIPDYSTSYSPEDYVPYDPVTGRPTYPQQ